jgi:hypothetical protein
VLSQEVFDTFLRDRIDELLTKERRAEAQQRALYDMHRKDPDFVADTCIECYKTWPCPTIKAIRNE